MQGTRQIMGALDASEEKAACEKLDKAVAQMSAFYQLAQPKRRFVNRPGKFTKQIIEFTDCYKKLCQSEANRGSLKARADALEAEFRLQKFTVELLNKDITQNHYGRILALAQRFANAELVALKKDSALDDYQGTTIPPAYYNYVDQGCADLVKIFYLPISRSVKVSEEAKGHPDNISVRYANKVAWGVSDAQYENYILPLLAQHKAWFDEIKGLNLGIVKINKLLLKEEKLFELVRQQMASLKEGMRMDFLNGLQGDAAHGIFYFLSPRFILQAKRNASQLSIYDVALNGAKKRANGFMEIIQKCNEDIDFLLHLTETVQQIGRACQKTKTNNQRDKQNCLVLIDIDKAICSSEVKPETSNTMSIAIALKDLTKKLYDIFVEYQGGKTLSDYIGTLNNYPQKYHLQRLIGLVLRYADKRQLEAGKPRPFSALTVPNHYLQAVSTERGLGKVLHVLSFQTDRPAPVPMLRV